MAAGIALGAVTLLFLLACIRLHWLRGYLSHRHVLVPAALMLPLAGRGVLRLAERFRPGAVLVTVLVVGAILLPKTLSAQGEGKEALREMGRVVAAADAPAGPLALHGDPRVAYYAGRTALRLPGPLREVVREGGLAAAFGPELEAWLRDRGASLYVFPDQFEDVPAAGLRPLSGGAALLLPGGGPGR